MISDDRIKELWDQTAGSADLSAFPVYSSLGRVGIMQFARAVEEETLKPRSPDRMAREIEILKQIAVLGEEMLASPPPEPGVIMARANAALPHDDPRKFTWADYDLWAGRNPEAQVIADKIRALLPPRA